YDITQLKHPNEAIKDPFMFRLSWGILIILLIGYFVSEWVNIPVSLIAGVVAIIFLLFAKRSPAVETMTVLKGAPWDIVFLSIGMFFVVYGLRYAVLMIVFVYVIYIIAQSRLL